MVRALLLLAGALLLVMGACPCNCHSDVAGELLRLGAPAVHVTASARS
jgi:hypothetical protein